MSTNSNQKDSASTDTMIQEDSLPTCACGHNRNHYMVRTKGEYTAFGHFLVTFGITYQPIKIRYRCSKCNTFFDETTDPKILKSFY